jgi:hypothetical protein
MLETIQSVSLLTFMEVVGPIVLAAALAYGIFMTRRRSRASRARTDAATRENYRKTAMEERNEAELRS